MRSSKLDRARVKALVADLARWCGSARERRTYQGTASMRGDAQTWRALAHQPRSYFAAPCYIADSPEECMAWAILYRAMYLGSTWPWRGTEGY